MRLRSLILAIAFLAAACTTAGASLPQPDQATTTLQPVRKVLTIWEENHDISALSQMPYLRSLANTYGQATHYRGVTHPSLGNYLVAVSGQGANTCGLRDPLPAGCPQSARTVFGQALAAGLTAKSYAESMATKCKKTGGTNYAPRHNPWVYFTNETTQCLAHDVPLGTTTSTAGLKVDAEQGILPNAGLIAPNLCNDAHDCSLAVADGWLKKWMPLLLAGPDYRSGRLAIVVTFDEGSGSSQTVPFVVVNPRESGRVVTGSFTHYALCRLYDDVLGVAPLPGCTATGLKAAFGL
jgi:phosphatidylinositol-3-phosphatase